MEKIKWSHPNLGPGGFTVEQKGDKVIIEISPGTFEDASSIYKALYEQAVIGYIDIRIGGEGFTIEERDK